MADVSRYSLQATPRRVDERVFLHLTNAVPALWLVCGDLETEPVGLGCSMWRVNAPPPGDDQGERGHEQEQRERRGVGGDVKPKRGPTARGRRRRCDRP